MIIEGKLKLSKDVCERINALLEIEDFEENKELLEDLGFCTDSLVLREYLKIDGYKLILYIITGQTNAWIDFQVIAPDGEVYESEPAFGPIEGEYTINIDSTTVLLQVESY